MSSTSSDSPAAPVARGMVGLILAAAAILGATVSAGLTASPIADRCWTAAFAAIIVAASSRAARTPLLVLAVAAIGVGIGSGWLVPAGAALLLAIAVQRDAIASSSSRPILGALIGAFASATLLHPPDGESSLLIGALILFGVIPTIVSAVRTTHGPAQRRVAIGSIVLAALIGVSTLLAIVLGALAMPSLRDAVASSRDGVSSTRAGDLEQAATAFGSASDQYAHAAGFVDSVLMEPASLLPIIGANIDAARTVIGAGQQLATSAADTVSAAPYNTVELSSDGIDLDRVRTMQGPVAQLDHEVAAVQSGLDGIDRRWLLGPIAARVSEFSSQVTTVAPQIETASMTLDALPDLLGASTTRTYLVEFTSESESRFLGGFVGSYALLTADHGHLALDRSESISNLNRRLGPDSTYMAPIEFKNLYEPFHPQMFAQNWTAAPDLPSDVSMVEQLFAQATGVHIDGVMVIDPFGLASLLKLTGPIRVEGIRGALNADNAAEYLLHGQYLEFEGQTDERRDQLAAVGQRAFDALLRSPRTTYREISRTLGPAVSEGHLMFSVLDPSTETLLDRLGLSGRFVAPTDAAMFSFRYAASFANKIDYFLHRSTHIDAEIDPATSRIESDVTIELRNDAPSGGLPAYVIGNDNGEPTGTNGMYFSIYTTLALSGTTLDGQPFHLPELPDRGMRVFSRGITIAPGATRTLRFHLSGAIPSTSMGYRLDLPLQPSVTADTINWSMRSSNPDYVASTLSGVPDTEPALQDDTLSAEMISRRSLSLTTMFRRSR